MTTILIAILSFLAGAATTLLALWAILEPIT